MRLDLFLKSSRIILRRTLAQEFCDANLVKINGVIAKSSREVKVNDEIEIKRSQKLFKYRVLQVPAKKQVSRTDAANLYEVVSEEVLTRRREAARHNARSQSSHIRRSTA